IDVRDLHIDLENHVVTRAGRRLDLSATEYRLLVELAMNAGRVLTHRQILERVWGPEYGSEVSLIRPYVKSLRKTLGDDPRSPSFLFTERQVGYLLIR